MKFFRNPKLLRTLSITAFVIYTLFLIWALLLKFGRPDSLLRASQSFEGYNVFERFTRLLNPFSNIYFVAIPKKPLYYVRLWISNVLIFIPYGFLASCFIKKRQLLRCFLLSLAVSAVIEFFQGLFGIGTCESHDLITNSLGGVIGCLCYRLIHREKHTAHLNVFLTVACICAVPAAIFVLYQTVTLLPLYRQIFFRLL